MTRINVIPPRKLSRQHLLAEYRELPRVFALVRKAQGRGITPQTLKAPPCYTLGKGHVLFFYDKLLWLVLRHTLLVDEMLRRGYQARFRHPPREGIDDHWFNDWKPTAIARHINLQRIKERTK